LEVSPLYLYIVSFTSQTLVLSMSTVNFWYLEKYILLWPGEIFSTAFCV